MNGLNNENKKNENEKYFKSKILDFKFHSKADKNVYFGKYKKKL